MKLKQSAIVSMASLAMAFSLPAWSELPSERVTESSADARSGSTQTTPFATSDRSDDATVTVLPGFYLAKADEFDVRDRARDLGGSGSVSKTDPAPVDSVLPLKHESAAPAAD